jgi:phage shock protein C
MSIADDLTQLEQLRDRGSLSPDEFQRAKNKLLSGQARPAEPLVRSLNAMRRSTTDRWVGGVCGGLAVATGMEAWLWRIVFVACFAMGGFGLVAYVLLWIFVPLESADNTLTIGT